MKIRKGAAACVVTAAWWVLFVGAPLRASAESVGDFLVPVGAVWRYLDDGSNQGTAWRAPGFDDSAWAQGPAELGYGDGPGVPEATVVNCGPSAPACNANNFITSYFRHSFTVADPASIPQLQLALERDDGAVVYLNGVEVARSNMPSGTIGAAMPAQTAVGGSGETTFFDFPLCTADLVAGENVLAVEIHQSSPSSSDISFDASLQVVAAPLLALARAPYLQNVTPTSAVVRWRTNVPSTTRLEWGLVANAPSHTIDVPSCRTEHEVALSGLPPETKIFYSVGSSAQTLAGGDANHVFGTPPPAGTHKPLRIWVIGDSGLCATSAQGCLDAAAVRDGYLAYAGSQPADLWLLLGDNAYNTGTDAELTAGFFDVYPTVMRSTPMWSVPGNHEFGASDSPTQSGPYFDSFSFPKAGEGGGVPSGTEAYYSVDWGNVHFVALDSHDTDRSAPTDPVADVCAPGQGGAMYQWLCADLASTAQDFIVALWHHPPYTKGSHDSDNAIDSDARMQEMRERFLPVMDAYGVDLVLTGHSHSYERSILLRDHYGVSSTYNPALHAVDAGDGDPLGDGSYLKSLIGSSAGSGGVYSVVGSSSQASGGPLNHPVMEVSLNLLGSMLIDVVGRQLDARFLGVAGNTVDQFRIVKGPELAACSNGLDDDGDGRIDSPADDGCASASDPSEQVDCADGLDNDGDGLIDAGSAPTNDPGCLNLLVSSRENPACNDGLDNDGDQLADWPADPQCTAAWGTIESPQPSACGLGFELGALLPALAWLRQRRGGAAARRTLRPTPWAALTPLLYACALALPAGAAELFAERIDASNALLRRMGGPDAVGGIGDFALGDGVLCAVVSDPSHENDLAAGGGTLMDLGRCGRRDDQFLALEQMANLSLSKMIPIRSVVPERDAASARLVARGERDGVTLETRYSVRATEPGRLRVETRIARRGPGEPLFALGAAFANVHALRPFLVSTKPGGPAPGFVGASFIGRGARAAAAAAVAADAAVLVGEDSLAPGVSYGARVRSARLERASSGAVPLPVFLIADDLATIFAVFAQPFWIGGVSSLGVPELVQTRFMDLAAGDVIVLEMELVVGERADVASALDATLDDERALLRGHVDDATARLHLDRLDGTPATQVRPGADGSFAARLPAGEYRLRVWAPGRPEAARVVRVEAEGTDLGLVHVDAPARIELPRGHAMRLVFLGENGTPDPRLGDDLLGYRVEGAQDVVRTAAVRDLSLSGTGADPESVVVAPGSYRVLATRGPEYDVTESRVEARAGESVALAIAPPPRVLETPGWISADFHVHAAPSPDSALPLATRVASYAAEGAEVLISTDHDMITDYAPVVAELGLASQLATLVGVEVTSEVRTPVAPYTTGHANAFPLVRDPLAYRGGAPRNEGRRWREILADLRARPGERVVQLNHPRSATLHPRSYFTHLAFVGEPYDPSRPLSEAPNRVLMEADPATGIRDIDFDAIELLNGERMESYAAVRADWFSLLRQGVVLSGTANSDSHRLATIVGAPRNYIPVEQDSVAALDAGAFVRAVREGRSFGTTGPLLDVKLGEARAGDRYVGSSGVLAVRVRAAPWVAVSTLRVFVDGVEVRRSRIRDAEAAAIPLLFERDGFVTIEVEGEPGAIYAALLPHLKPFAFSNPIYVDADDDGRWTAPGLPVRR